MPERKMGMAMGQDCELLEEVCGWINNAATKPVWAKMTPNITDITDVRPPTMARDRSHNLICFKHLHMRLHTAYIHTYSIEYT